MPLNVDRGLAIARLKLGEVEAHRDILMGELSKLVISNEESVSNLFRDQERKYLDELINKRNSYEEKSSVLTVSICEMNADRARHEISMAANSSEVQILECRVTEVTDQLITVNKKLLACKSVQIINQTQYDDCEKMHIEKEAEHVNLRSEIDDLRELFRQKVTQFFDNFTKYGQKLLAEKYCAHFCSSLNTEVQPFSKSVLYESMNGEEKLYQLISQDQDKSKQLIEDFVGEDQLCLLHENPQQCLRKFRFDCGHIHYFEVHHD